jgi:hypothetical protein
VQQMMVRVEFLGKVDHKEVTKVGLLMENQEEAENQDHADLPIQVAENREEVENPDDSCERIKATS